MAKPDYLQLARYRISNALQLVLVIGALALVLAIPAWLLAGPAGVLWAMFLAVLASLTSGGVSARLVLAQQGARPLQRRQAPGLYELFDRLLERAGITGHMELFYAPSGMLNAFAVGSAGRGGVAVTDTLLRTLSTRELAGVLAHEVSHLRHNDTRVMAMAAAMAQLTVTTAAIVQIVLLFSLPAVMSGAIDIPWLLLLMVAIAPTLSTLLHLALYRNREYTADLEAATLTGDPRGLASALDVLERYNSSWLAGLFGGRRVALPWLQTHPPSAERIRRLLALETLPDAPAGQPLTKVFESLIHDYPPAGRQGLRRRPWRF